MLLLLLACSAGASHEEGVSVTILSPEEEAVVCGAPLVVETEVTGVTLVDPYDPPEPLPEDGAHLDVMLNGQDAMMSDEEVVEIPDVVEGAYQLKVELSGIDHLPIEPYAGDYLYITVSSGACGT